jgi:hypothetical protein
MPQEIIDSLNHDLNAIKDLLDSFSQHLRALDRMRLNGVGIKKLGFIERAYELALENGEFLPHYLTLERFGVAQRCQAHRQSSAMVTGTF